MMGQLFWKFLLAFWSALAFAFGLIWAVVQLSTDPGDDRPMFGPQARLIQQSAQTMVDAGGIELLRKVVAKWDLDPIARERILILDAMGQDLLQRPVPADWRQQLVQRSNQADFALHSADGQHWQLLAVANPQFWPGRWRNFGEPEPLEGERRFTDRGPALENGVMRRPPTPPFWFHPSFILISIVLTSMASSLVLAWYFASPVRQLRQALGALPKEQWRTQLSGKITSRKDEFGELARSFNLMAQSVYLAILSQRRLLHDVSHELRSPLARLQILIGLARQTPSEQESALAKVETEAARLDELVGEILTFSRLESGEVNFQLQEVDLTELLESICDDGQLEAAAQHKHLQLAELPQILVSADAELLYRALENVIRNAIKYTAEDSLVLVRALVLDQSVRVLVDDDGCGLPPEQLPLIFNPFFRSHSTGSGVGLGLSIAQRAISACGGTINAENRLNAAGERCGLRISIELPLLQAS
ncbi:HAMP domain-containing protein [Rheinheimera riviphila]|uniref:histidine kinase n=1 Tax=Rheinheimera riviphila TaxID=1834037 RepID=A0A437QC58_9GAMM|nr:ATP-binding protein [Rheinheimera riviphila]RVU31953.1 HAMP domain-containing protein [Rheinheimera riviphila]